MRVRVRFIRQGSNSAIGGFSPGDRKACDARMADHLVNEARVAEFIEDTPPAPVAAVVVEPPQEATPPKKRRAKA